jgi:5-methylcytosine-specific restriction endonuclease McrA
MPSNPKGYMGAYYRKNKSKFNNPLEKKKRAARNKAHKMMEKKVGHKIHSYVDHIKPLKKGGKTTLSNLRVMSKKKNRARK